MSRVSLDQYIPDYIEKKQGDLLQPNAETLVDAVNSVGVMG